MNLPVGIQWLIAALAGGLIGFFIGWFRNRGGNRQIDLSSVLNRFDVLEKGNERTERVVKDEIARQRDEIAGQSRALREELGTSLKNAGDSTVNSLGEIGKAQRGQLETFSGQLNKLIESNEKKLGELRNTVEMKLAQIQTDNAAKLEEMRRTVDEKLQGTLEKRLGESFKLVSDRLEQVHKGLGEMQVLAIGVGDLKKVLTNVKTRGTWGEIQLGSLLEQILTAEQYAQNVQTKQNSSERVEFAIKLPGRDGDGNAVWLPIDAKFPKEDYERLMVADERADAAGVEEASKQLEARIKLDAKNIRDKYLDPPNTTDFGILYLPTEGLYGEVLRRPGLTEFLQREFRVNVAGPTTLWAILNALQMGFRTLSIQKRSSEVWTLLGAVKTEFGKFGEVIEKVQKKIQEAGNAIDSAASKTKTIQRKLKDVQELPTTEAAKLIPLELENLDAE
jgi:DNA recombination protein RmuC